MHLHITYTPQSHHLENGFSIDTDRERLDVAYIFDFLSQSYWGKGLTMEKLQQCINASVCFGLYDGEGKPCGFARAVTDGSRMAFLADVFVDEAWRGQGLGKLLMGHILHHSQLAHIQSWLLNTQDAHGLYARFGFVPANDKITMSLRREG